jgi:hypothetical protein
MKLKLEDLAPYLPYGLTWFCLDEDSREIEHLPTVKIYDLQKQTIEIGGMDIDLAELPYPDGLTIKPILRPLFDLENEEYENRIFNREYIIDKEANSELGYYEWCYLFENHFDVFGLIEKGLAIDINTLKQ